MQIKKTQTVIKQYLRLKVVSFKENIRYGEMSLTGGKVLLDSR